MVSSSYIRLREAASPNLTGKRMYINIVRIRRVSGIQTVDLALPTQTADKTGLYPVTGFRDNFSISIELLNEDVNTGSYIDSSGTETAEPNSLTVQEQYLFLHNQILNEGITASYQLYIDFLGETYTGYLSLSSDIDPETFNGSVIVNLDFKVGQNPLSFFS